MKSKKELELFLSRLKDFENKKVILEQYTTPSNIAAEILWFAFMNEEIKNKVIMDLGCGNGIFGIGALKLGAKKVYFVDKSEEAIEIVRSNLKSFKINTKKCVFIKKDVNDLKRYKIDLIIQNPPFGVKKKHADRDFLEKALKFSVIVYSLHKFESGEFIEKNFGGKLIFRFKFPLKRSYKFHRKSVYFVDVGCWKFLK